MSVTISVYDHDPVEGLETCVSDPSSAQIKVWHAQAMRDKNMISGKELAIVEKIAGESAGRSRTIYNPFTGEIRKAFLPDWVKK